VSTTGLTSPFTSPVGDLVIDATFLDDFQRAAAAATEKHWRTALAARSHARATTNWAVPE
jgi:hypothetical protein